MHKLLERQIRRIWPSDADVPAEVRPLLAAIEQTYLDNDADRTLLERSLELTSQDLLQRNAELRKMSEQALAKSKAQLESVVNTAADAILTTDSEGLIIMANPAAERTFGRIQAELVGQPLAVLLPERFQAAYKLALERFRSAGEAPFLGRTIEFFGVRKDGNEFPLEVSIATWTADGKPHFTSVMRDITTRKQDEATLRSAIKAAEAAAEAKSQFLANMSHEIRTPMNAILGLSRLLRESGLDTSQEELAEGVRVSGEHLVTIINDILDFSKLEAGRVEIIRQPVDLVDLGRSSLGLIEASATAKHLDLRFQVVGPSPLVAMADGPRVRQVLLNLLSNAVKFTSAGSVTLTVSGIAGPSGVQARFEVADTGIGIPKDRYDRLFQSFSQVDASTTRTYGGTGLGLAISKRLVELMGGAIGFSSNVGLGSRFYFTLSGEAAQLPAPVPTVSLPTSGHGRPLAILLAEDNAMNQTVAIRMMERLGHKADVVATGAEAVDAVQRRHYDIVLMDIHMPIMDGVEATQQIHARLGEKSPWIVAMTADAMPGDRERFLAAGADGYLSKPVRLEELAEALGQPRQKERDTTGR